ncbi:MAG TPA: ATP-dependent zinc metalloprotease FtsH [Acidimicrobiales bacterium]|jgi:cell division protease FtsH
MVIYAVIAIAVLSVLIVPNLLHKANTNTLTYNTFLSDIQGKQIHTATIDQTTGVITGTLADGRSYTVNGPNPVTDSELNALKPLGSNYKLVTPTSNPLVGILGWVLPFVLIGAVFFYVSRKAQGQMGSIMSIGRSKAKLYSTERPSTTFDDVAGYDGVKLEISEVVDFLKTPARFKEIGARIPKGILLVGPPGTGKTLLARAVAGEAGVPFMSVSGSDFMEMFVGVGASRVRDLFATARKQAPAIVFIDEIDSIGRKRGAGLGGGHDEREQTLNQMLSEMDGFDPTEGIVVMAATNRPDILDAAILRPGRFDRQIVVPLPDLDERLPILQVHCKDKRVDPSVDLGTVARGTPGMSGADLANLVNEAALHAVRRGSKVIQNVDFEASRDRVLMGQRRESLVLSGAEKERVAFHEGGHAVLAYVLPDADPVHKVTILPTGMALGVTMQLPMEERHIHPRQHIEDSLAVRMGGRAAELLVYGDLSTGASNDLVGNTELARKMVREWGMSDKIGPMAWGSQGQVFLGEDLMHTRDYSEHTSQIIDDEVEIILRAQEERALEVLARHRGGLDAVARALLDEETIDGETVGQLVDTAYGRPVHEHGVKTVPPIFVASQHGPTGSDNVDGPPGGANGTAPGTVSGADPGDGGGEAPAPTRSPEGGPGEAEVSTGSEVSNAAHASDQEGATGSADPANPGDPAPQAGEGQVGPAPWPPPADPAAHWPHAPSPIPAQPPGHWPKKAPWPPPPPPASR